MPPHSPQISQEITLDWNTVCVVTSQCQSTWDIGQLPSFPIHSHIFNSTTWDLRLSWRWLWLLHSGMLCHVQWWQVPPKHWYQTTWHHIPKLLVYHKPSLSHVSQLTPFLSQILTSATSITSLESTPNVRVSLPHVTTGLGNILYNMTHAFWTINDLKTNITSQCNVRPLNTT
jgi:hypothetical protein